VNVADVDLNDIAGLVRACPKAKFMVHSASGVAGSVLGRKNNGLPANYAVDIARLSVEFGNELQQVLDTLGEDRVLFGTGIPFHYAGPGVVKLEMLQASAAVQDKIRSQNAARWIDLPARG
jgi:predicted TIM-barrel fold metal-dependent hydrolase